MALTPGSRLGPYELLSLIGVGGMGQVYRARDTRLGRTVAIKILPPNRSGVGDFAERFQREARAISSLNHPNICSLFDVGEAQVPRASGGEVTVSYLVMEFLDGSPLRDKLRERLPLRQAIDYAVQIAGGLAAAHRRGFVHRDLKPENIFVTREGATKILDFGLVKAVAPESDPELARQAATMRHTEPGLMVGTAHYMSPEQVRGDRLDHRSDIFSFGVVLYEMFTGIQPFFGDTAVETMTKVLRDEPRPLTELVPDLPPGIEAIVLRCLAKEPEDRFASARDVAFSLDAISRASRSPLPSMPPRLHTTSPTLSRTGPTLRTSRRSAYLGAALALAIALVVFAGRSLTQRDERPGPPATRPLTHSGKDSAPAFSPDGRLVAFVSSRDGSRRVWLKQLADGAEVALTEGPDDGSPRFLPDGSAVLFTRRAANGAALHRIPVVGGESRKTIDDAFDADVARDGRTVAFIRNRTAAGAQRVSTVCIANPDGGDVRELLSSGAEEFAWPRWSPDGEWLAITRRPRGSVGGSIVMVRPDDGTQRVIARGVPHGPLSAVAWRADSRAFVFAELEAITAAAFSTRGGGARIFLYETGSGAFTPILWNAHASLDSLDVGPSGRLVFSEDFTRQNLQQIAVGGNDAQTRWLTRGTSSDRQPTWTPDGRRVVFCSDRGGNADLWAIDFASGGVRRLTDHGGVDWDPALMPDGSLLWSSNRGGHFEVWTATADGGSARQVTNDGFDAENPSTPRAGDWIYYDSSHPEKEGLWRVRPDGSDARVVIRGETAHPEVSADGQYVVYHRPEPGGTSVVEVVRVEDGATFLLAGSLPGTNTGRARWLGASHTIVFQAEDAEGRSGLFVQEFVPGQDTTATRRVLAGFEREASVETFAISPDGTGAVLSMLEPSSTLIVAENVEALIVRQ